MVRVRVRIRVSVGGLAVVVRVMVQHWIIHYIYKVLIKRSTGLCVCVCVCFDNSLGSTLYFLWTFYVTFLLMVIVDNSVLSLLQHGYKPVSF